MSSFKEGKMLRELAITAYQLLYVRRLLRRCVSVLDLGCGRGSRSLEGLRLENLVGVDLWFPYLVENRRTGVYSDLALVDLKRLPFPDKCFDGVVAFDVLEHLSKQEGFRMLKEADRLAKKIVIVRTPNGFSPKEIPEDGAPTQMHLSGWLEDDFRQMGYVVRGLNGLRAFKGERDMMKVQPALIGHVATILSQPIMHRLPSLAFHLLCIKKL